jgi:hypothetical protein
MKRTFLAAAGASLLALGAPSIAAAHHSKHHASCTSRKHHRAKCAHPRSRVLAFGPVMATGTTTSPAPAPASPSTETAGTVTSYVAPVLTITLKDGTVVSGKVTENTEIECESATPGSDEEGGDDEGGTSGDARIASTDDGSTASGGEDGNDQGDDDGSPESCTTAKLVPGAVVRAAELVIGTEGAIWEKVDLIS